VISGVEAPPSDARGGPPPPAEAALIRAAQAGDHAAFEQLYRTYIGQVYALCLRMVADATTAESLAQDVFVRAWRKLATFKGRGAFGGWLRRMTVNLVIEDRRRLKREGRVLDHRIEVEAMDQGKAGHRRDREPNAPMGAAAHPPATETAILLERAIAALPPHARQVFVLHDVTGYRYREIADIMGIALGTVKAHLHRARGLLRQELDRSGEGGLP